MDLMVTTNQKPIIDAQMKKRKESKHNTKDSHQILRERSKRRTTKNYKNNQKTSNKMAINAYLSVIILNCKGLSAPFKNKGN